MTLDIATDAALSRDIEALRERFTQTQELYREVCALLFFRYGVTPTANKLYQLVRKGSMSAPSEALTKFWTDLREKSRTRIEHPDLPDTLKEVAGELLSTLWTNAQAAAQESLTAYRADAQEKVLQAKATAAAARSERDAILIESENLKDQLGETRKQVATLRERLAALEATRSSLLATLDEARLENTALQRQLEEVRRGVAVELDKLRATIELAEERARSTEQRMLLEVDRERTATAKLQKKLEVLTVVSRGAADEHRRDLSVIQQTLGDTRQKNGQLEGALRTVTTALKRAELDTQRIQSQLNESIAQTMQVRSEAENWRRQFEESQGFIKKIRTVKATGRKPQR